MNVENKVENMSLPSEMLLHPEFLSNEQILSVIKERHLRIPNIELMCRDQLLEIFNNFCVPHGQRKCRDGVRGKTPIKNRCSGEMEVDALKPISPCKQVNKSWHLERLRPPPDLLSSHIKRIKISVDFNTNSILSKEDIKRKIEVHKEIVSDGPTPQKKLKKPITWP